LLVLHLLAQGPAHGYQIARQIRAGSQGVLDFSEGALYPSLHALERQGLLESRELEENGRLRRSYRLTPRGREQLAAERQAWRSFAQAVERILAEEPDPQAS